MSGIIQIAGIMNQKEAEMLMERGVDWLGFPLRLTVHKEDLPEAEAARIIRKIRLPHEAVLITYLNRADEIVGLSRRLGVRRVQLHGPVLLAELKRTKAIAPNLFLIKSLIVKKNNRHDLEEELIDISPCVDAFITDTFDPESNASGATGKTHDWKASRRLVEISERPVILAGGLNPENVASAIEQVQPAGVDAHTGVENSDGRKDLELVQRFVSEARKGFNRVSSARGFA